MRQDSRRILFVVNVGWFFVSHRLPLAVAARNRGYDVHVASALHPELDTDTEKVLSEAGLNFHRLDLSRRGAGPRELLREFGALRALYKRVRPDIVHLVTIKPVLLGGLVGRLLGQGAVVLAIPGRGPVFSSTGALAAMRRWAVLVGYRLAYRPRRTRVIVQNVEDREYFVSRRVFRDDDVVLIRGSGVDLATFARKPEPEGAPVIVLASRMLRSKGIEYFVAAARALKERGRDARFVLVGEPDAGNASSHAVDELVAWARSGAVEWWGFKRNMTEVLAACHIVCLPTFYGEGVPKILIEAAAVGRAIVTTDAPGCRDIVRDRHNGLLVQPRDVDGLVAALDRLITRPDERRLMGDNGRKLVEAEFSVDTVVASTLELYGALVG